MSGQTNHKGYRITRREALKLFGAGAAGMVGSSLLGKPAAASTALPAQTKIAMPAVVKPKPEKIVVGVGGWAEEPTKQAVKELGFTEVTGVEVDVQVRPGAPPEFISQMTSAITAGSSPYDVIDIEDEAAISFSRAGWLEPLDGILPLDFWSDWPQSMLNMIETWSRYEGAVFRISHNYEAQYFWIRKDWFDEKGVEPPTTWEEVVGAAKIFTDPAKGVWGIEDGLAKGAYLMVHMSWLCKQAGGLPYDFGEPMKLAMEYLNRLINVEKVFPVGALNKDYDASNQDYMADRVAMMRQWPYFYDVSRGKKDWFAEDKAFVILPPKGPVSNESWAASWGWVIPKTAANKEAAQEFVKFMVSKENAPKLAEMSTWWLNARHSVLEVMKDKGLGVLLSMYSQAGVIGTRPFHPKFMEATSLVEDIVSAYLTGQISLDAALEQGKKQMAELG